MAVTAAGGISGPPVVIGHSMGGFVTIATAASHGDDVSGVIVCDSPVTEPDPEIGAHLAEVWWKQGKTKSAEDLLRTAHQESPDNESVRKAFKTLGLQP